MKQTLKKIIIYFTQENIIFFMWFHLTMKNKIISR